MLNKCFLKKPSAYQHNYTLNRNTFLICLLIGLDYAEHLQFKSMWMSDYHRNDNVRTSTLSKPMIYIAEMYIYRDVLLH